MAKSVPALTRKHRKLLRRRRRALLRKHYSLGKRLGIAARRVAQQITRLEKRKHGEFKPYMLQGLPGNITNATKRVIGHAYDNFNLRVSATTNGTHAPGSWHYPDSPQNDGKHGAAVDLYGSMEDMERYQRHQASRPSYFNELFGPIDGACVKDGERITISGSLAEQHDNHDHVAPRSTYR
jgi:hypothetical protein